MKNSLLKFIVCSLMLFLSVPGKLLACEVCRRNQPEILQDISHGVGPLQFWDNMIVIGASVLVTVVLFYSIKLLWRPKEYDSSHIKYLIKDF